MKSRSNTMRFRVINISLLLILLGTLVGCAGIPDLTEHVDGSDIAGEAVSELQEVTGGAASTFQSVAEEMAPVLQQAAGEAASEAASAVGEAASETMSAVLDGASSTGLTISGLLSSTDDINLTSSDDKNYTFYYDGQVYTAIRTTDHWKIKNSYNITNEADMLIICQALIDLYPIHGSDMISYRTPEDMVYEWHVHNIAYALLPDDDEMKPHVRDVDFNPEDQGRSFDEIYEAHTGKKFDINEILGR